MTTATKPTLLMILDGWGHRSDPQSNAISMAKTPVWDSLLATRPNTLIHTSGSRVGLPEGQMGNSEVGHMNLGAGRIVYQSLSRINKAIEEGDFFHNTALCNAVDSTLENDNALHIIGLLSPGGIHSHEDQIEAMVKLAQKRGCKKVYLHVILDGRDTAPKSAASSLEKFKKILSFPGNQGHIASLIGRFYAMDRDNRWERVASAFNLICQGQANHHFQDPSVALEAAYERGETDEFAEASAIHSENSDAISLQAGDAIVFMNFRADRARELTRAFVDSDFSGFKREQLPNLSDFVTLTQYSADLKATCAFSPLELSNVLGEYLANNHKKQLRIAETEKYAHVTFFFSGGKEDEFSGESRILVPSPDVATYDLQPEMSAHEVCELLVKAIKSCEYDTIICNFANGDMVGHTGVIPAAIKAVETLDECMQKVTTAILEVDGDCLITADHGNVEQMLDTNTGQPLTSHTTGPVPLVYVGNKKLRLVNDGALSDIAPSLLTLMGMEKPKEMTGQSLIELNS